MNYQCTQQYANAFIIFVQQNSLSIQMISKNMKSILYIIIASSVLFFSAVEANSTPSHYGPIKEGETLWYIAYKHKPAGVSRWKMMRAIHLYNRSSFNNGDINLLQKGATLRLPVNKQEVDQFIRGTMKAKASSPSIATNMPTELKKAHAELRVLRDELTQSRSALNALKKESNQLSKGERSQFKKNIANLQQQIVKLEQENAAIKKEKLSNTSANISSNSDKASVALALKTQELEKAYQEVIALKQQNTLLKEQASAQDSNLKNTQKKDKLVSETIAALNADIGQLRSRIKELEELEKLKDAHIAELKKTLQHATKVIKDQDVINRKMHAQLADLKENGASPMPMPNTAILEQKDNMQAGVAPPLSEMVKNISPKFWLLLTLGGLLVVLSLLWRSLSQRNFIEVTEEPRRDIQVIDEKPHRPSS